MSDVTEWIDKTIGGLIAKLQSDAPGFELLDKNCLYDKLDEHSLVIGWYGYYQDNLLIPVFWIAKMAKSRHSNITLSWEIGNAFRRSTTEEKNKLISMTNKRLREDGITLYYSVLNNFWVHEKYRKDGCLQFQDDDVGRILRCSFVGGVRSKTICSNCDSWEQINFSLYNSKKEFRGRCDNPDYLDKILSGPIFPEWDTKVCGYFDPLNEGDYIEIDFNDLEKEVNIMGMRLVQKFFD